MVDAGKPEHHGMPHRHPSLRRRQVIAQVIVGTVILVSGIAIGGGGTILALKDRIVPVFGRSRAVSSQTGNRDPNRVARPSGWIAEQWKDDYDLNEKQTQQARDMLAKEFLTTERLREEFRKAELTQREKFVLAVKAILTPEQFTKWESDFRKMVARMENMRPFDPHRGGRGGPRPDWRPDPRMNSGARRGDWRPGPPRDPNEMRGDRPRNRFRGSDGRRGNRPRESFMDSNDSRGPRPPEPLRDPNGPPEDLAQPQ